MGKTPAVTPRRPMTPSRGVCRLAPVRFVCSDSRLGDAEIEAAEEVALRAPRTSDEAGEVRMATARRVLRVNGVKQHEPLQLELRDAKISHVARAGGEPVLYLQPGGAALQFLLRLDEWMLQQARQSAPVWFGAVDGDVEQGLWQGSEDLVDECFRSSASTDLRNGVLARMLLDREPPPSVFDAAQKQKRQRDAVYHQPADVNITVRLMGMRFRPQQCELVWRVVRSSPVDAHTLTPSFTCPTNSMVVADESDGEDIGPGAPECQEMREALSTRLAHLEEEASQRLESVRGWSGRLKQAAHTDVATLDELLSVAGDWPAR